jgi:predicted naringenin-chalcone synthase
MDFRMLGLGLATPPHFIEQDDAAQLAVTTLGDDNLQRQVDAVYRRSGVRRRHCAVLESSTNGSPALQNFFSPSSPGTPQGPSTAERMSAYAAHAVPLALQASQQALVEAGVQPGEVTHLVTASCTGFDSPGVDLQLCERLGLAPSVSRTHIGFMGCHAALNALRVAAAFSRTDQHAIVLTCAVELCSLHFQYDLQSDSVVSNALFADGAAAVVGAANWERYGPANDQAAAIGSLRSQATLRLPETRELMSWRIGDHGFRMGLSPRVPAIIRRELRAWLEEWLGRQGLRRGDVAGWAIHPGGPRILDACGDGLGLAPEELAASREVLARYGNMSSPTVLFVLDALQQRGVDGPCVMLAFGPGLTIEAALADLRPIDASRAASSARRQVAANGAGGWQQPAARRKCRVDG